MNLDTSIVSQHLQLDHFSCIPMSVELVLKLLGRVHADFYNLQREWRNRTDGSFALFDGRTIAGVRFRLHKDLPLDDLFRTIEEELAAGRCVIVSLPSKFRGSHMWVIHEKLPSGEFRAVSKKSKGSAEIDVEEQVRAIVRRINGTHILTYEISA
jgi:hypothetical protein